MTGLWKREYKELSIDRLAVGMETYDDVINRFGNVLIPANTEIVDLNKIKNLLEQHKIPFVKVKEVEGLTDLDEAEIIDVEALESSDDFTKIEEQLNEIKNKETIEEFRKGFKENQKKIQAGFEGIIKGQRVEKDQIKENVEKTLANFQGSINAFQLLEKMKDFDDLTYSHSQNVTVISHSIGKWLGLNQEQMQNLTLAAMLADIGKMKISKEVLNKVGKLSHDEVLECRRHVIESHELIKSYNFISEDVKQAVLLHHERMDGSGYPLGLQGEKIPLLARIIAIADVYNALTSYRPYRKKYSPFEAIKILETEFIDKLDSKVLYIYLKRIGSCFIGQKVKLSDGRIGEVVYITQQTIYKPLVKIIDTGEVIDLSHSKNALIQIVEFL